MNQLKPLKISSSSEIKNVNNNNNLNVIVSIMEEEELKEQLTPLTERQEHPIPQRIDSGLLAHPPPTPHSVLDDHQDAADEKDNLIS